MKRVRERESVIEMHAILKDSCCQKSIIKLTVDTTQNTHLTFTLPYFLALVIAITTASSPCHDVMMRA